MLARFNAAATTVDLLTKRGEGWSDPFWLTFGIFLLFLAVVYTYTGKAWVRFHGWVYRADRPKRYWLEVVMYYIADIALIGLFLYNVRAFSK
jgi:hypothetical protein